MTLYDQLNAIKKPNGSMGGLLLALKGEGDPAPFGIDGPDQDSHDLIMEWLTGNELSEHQIHHRIATAGIRGVGARGIATWRRDNL